MRKFEWSQRDESRAQLADSLKPIENLLELSITDGYMITLTIPVKSRFLHQYLFAIRFASVFTSSNEKIIKRVLKKTNAHCAIFTSHISNLASHKLYFVIVSSFTFVTNACKGVCVLVEGNVFKSEQNFSSRVPLFYKHVFLTRTSNHDLGLFACSLQSCVYRRHQFTINWVLWAYCKNNSSLRSIEICFGFRYLFTSIT